jgi:Fe-S-cluster containining protein
MYSALYLVIQKRGSPLPFECIQCGECCSHLGLVHSIREERGGNRFLLYNQYTGDEQEVVLDSDKIDLFSDKSTFEREPEACPFFRFKETDGKGYCTIHLTRPDICRDFSCWRLLVLDHTGRRAGRVMFIRTLVTEDPVLRRLWDECIDTIGDPDDAVWEDLMIDTLTRAGYSVRR